MLVNGIAGSGKTSVMLQRIAYLLYHQHETLSADQVYLFSPNEVFERYIDGVLPSMGEANPRLYTWRDFVDEQGAGNRDDGSNTPALSLELLEAGMPGLSIEDDDLRSIMVDDEVLLSGGQIFGVVAKFMYIVSARASWPSSPTSCAAAWTAAWPPWPATTCGRSACWASTLRSRSRLLGCAATPTGEDDTAGENALLRGPAVSWRPPRRP